ncbi:MAG: aminotransferase class I/II-fold pyridoxal phosphate-dependent enzyme [Proteobacteria bacterium]|nr:aminotransferase class I/II-fold pyridoxal phosphate-dependent enzyme [Pseudomonadota bacterium]
MTRAGPAADDPRTLPVTDAGRPLARARFSDRTRAIATRGAAGWTVSDRAAELAAGGADIIALGVGNVDLPTPAHVVAAAHESLDRGRTHYSAIAGEPALRAAVAQRVRRRCGASVTDGQVVVFPGAQSALFSAIQCLAGPGDEVILLEPVYATYEAVVAAAGATPVPVSLRTEAGFALDLRRIEAAMTPRTRALLLNTPNNPAGYVLSAPDVEALALACARHGLWLVSDEVYGEITFGAAHASPGAVAAVRDRLVIVDSLSKSHAMTGWRIGWAIGPPDLAHHLATLAQAELFGSPTFIQDAAVAALEGPQEICAAIRALYRERRDTLLAGLATVPGVTPFPSQGGMFLLADVAATGLRGDRFAAELLDATGVAVVPGEAFGASVADCVRIGLTQPVARLQEACARMRAWRAGSPAVTGR